MTAGGGVQPSLWRWIKPAAPLVSVALAIAAVPLDGGTHHAPSGDVDHHSFGGAAPLLDWPVVSQRTLLSLI